MADRATDQLASLPALPPARRVNGHSWRNRRLYGHPESLFLIHELKQPTRLILEAKVRSQHVCFQQDSLTNT